MLVDRVIESRGIDRSDKVFFDPNFYQFHDPFLMKDVARASKRILEARDNEDKTMIYGDYDCDGISGTALLTEGLEAVGLESSYILPSRLTDGYGLSYNLLDQAIESGVKLLITVDCGISDRKSTRLNSSHH